MGIEDELREKSDFEIKLESLSLRMNEVGARDPPGTAFHPRKSSDTQTKPSPNPVRWNDNTRI